MHIITLKRTGIALVAAVLLAAVAIPAVANANPFSNTRADLEVVRLSHTVGIRDAEGHVIINYVMGRQLWNVSGSVSNMTPNTFHEVRVGESGHTNRELTVASFTTDANGDGSFSARFVDLNDRAGGGNPEPPDFSAVRIYRPAQSLADLTSNRAEGLQGEIDSRGEGRGE